MKISATESCKTFLILIYQNFSKRVWYNVFKFDFLRIFTPDSDKRILIFENFELRAINIWPNSTQLTDNAYFISFCKTSIDRVSKFAIFHSEWLTALMHGMLWHDDSRTRGLATLRLCENRLYIRRTVNDISWLSLKCDDNANISQRTCNVKLFTRIQELINFDNFDDEQHMQTSNKIMNFQ